MAAVNPRWVHSATSATASPSSASSPVTRGNSVSSSCPPHTTMLRRVSLNSISSLPLPAPPPPAALSPAAAVSASSCPPRTTEARVT
eukprot:8739920-Pyramimonas_sp.AAC.1